MENEKNAVEEKVVAVDPFLVEPFPNQPRKEFDESWVTQLAASMKKHGQHTPVILTHYYGEKRGPKYMLIEGENRWRAAKKAGLRLRGIVRPVKDARDHYEKSAIANFFRKPHTAMEISGVVRYFRDEGHKSWEEIEEDLGMNKVTLREYYDLGNLDPKIQQRLSDKLPRRERLPISVGSELSRLPAEEQVKLVDSGQLLKKSADLARQLIRKRVEEVERSGGAVVRSRFGRARRPSDDTDMAETHLRRALSEIQLVIGMASDLKKAFRNRRVERNAETMDLAVQTRNEVSRLCRKLEEVMPANYREAVERATK